MKLLKVGINSRGIEFKASAMKMLINDSRSYKILIDWKKQPIDFQPLKKWIELWSKN